MFQLSGVHCKVFLLGVLGVERAVGLGRAVLGARVRVLGFGFQDLGFRVKDLGFRV